MYPQAPQASSFCSITTCQTNNCSSQTNFASLLNVLFVWLNHVIMYTGTFFIFTAAYYSIVWISHDLWWRTFCLQWFGTIINGNAIIILWCLWVTIYTESFSSVLWGAELLGDKAQTSLPLVDCPNLHSHQKDVKIQY